MDNLYSTWPSQKEESRNSHEFELNLHVNGLELKRVLSSMRMGQKDKFFDRIYV